MDKFEVKWTEPDIDRLRGTKVHTGANKGNTYQFPPGTWISIHCGLCAGTGKIPIPNDTKIVNANYRTPTVCPTCKGKGFSQEDRDVFSSMAKHNPECWEIRKGIKATVDPVKEKVKDIANGVVKKIGG